MEDNQCIGKEDVGFPFMHPSGHVKDILFGITDQFTHYSEIRSYGYNCLYKAQRHGKWFFLKGLKLEYRDNYAYRLMLKKEFDILITLNCPNIVQVYGMEENSFIGPCIVMEFIKGHTLAEIIQGKKRLHFPSKTLWQLLSALEQLSDRQIIHRDIKPENIIITEKGGNVKIVDFGLADSDNYAYYKYVAGTNPYIAPELLLKDTPSDCRSDLYSLGMLLKELSIKPYIRWKGLRPDPNARFSCPSAVKRFLMREYAAILVALIILLHCLLSVISMFFSSLLLF